MLYFSIMDTKLWLGSDSLVGKHLNFHAEDPSLISGMHLWDFLEQVQLYHVLIWLYEV